MLDIKQLKTKKGRETAGLFFVESKNSIAEIPPHITIKGYIISASYAENHNISQYKPNCEVIRDSVFNKLSDTVTPQGIIAVCQKIYHKPQDILQGNSFILLGENINDPGNMGTLIRTAAAAGASGAIFTEGSCDIYNQKVIRAAAGASLRLPIITLPAEEAFAALKSTPIYAAHPRGDTLPYSLNLTQNFCLLIGNETHGISPQAKQNATALVNLPMSNNTESLNAAVAGSILLYEAVRQRRTICP